MGTYWNAKIETKTARSKFDKDRERKVFIIRITKQTNGIAHVPFKIKTSRNDELFTSEADDFLSNMYSNTFGNGHVGSYWKCAYHGRTKKMSLYVVGCNKFTGLLIIDEDLYSLMPVGVSSDQIYRLDLLNSSVKLNISSQTIKDNSFLTSSKPISTHSLPTSDPISVNLNIDKSHFTNGVLTNSNQLNVYFNNLVIQSHLTWAYFYYEHNIRLRFNRISWKTDLKSLRKKSKLFNIDPNVINKPQNDSIQHIFNALYDTMPPNAVNIFFLPPLTNTNNLDGMASRATKTPLPCHENTKSLILLKEKEYKDMPNKKPEPSRFLKLAIEQANTLIDLIAENFGNSNSNNNLKCRHRKAGEFNWYFQSPYEAVPDSLESESNEYAVVQGTCINRSIKLLTQCNEMQVFREFCGNGIVENNEQCDCDHNDSKCAQCCDVHTCKFKNKANQCSSGECCDNNCQLKSSKTQCRASRHSTHSQLLCDWPEYCTGNSSSCPPDSRALNGIQCTSLSSSPSHCWNGECIDVDDQCKTNWSGKNSDISCYESFNVIGFENGNCGHNGSHYTPCSHRDAQCGLLNCQFGADKPLVKADAFFKATTNIRGSTNECKIITSSPMVYVSDGSRCNVNSATSGVCVQQKCVSVDEIIKRDSNPCYNRETKALCSNNGVCSNSFECKCDLEWSGVHCDQFVTGATKVPAEMRGNIETMGFERESYKSAAFFSIVGGAGALLLVMFLLMFLFCRRRRTSSQKSTNKFQTLDTTDGFTSNNPPLPPRSLTNSSSHTFIHHQSSHSLDPSLSSTSHNLSITQVNHAIKQLKVKPSKSILKKKPLSSGASSPIDDPLTVLDATANARTALVEPDTSMNDSTMKFERQVNINTLINSAIGTGHRCSRRSLNHNDRRSKFNESFSSSSSVDSNNDSNNSENSISSNLSNSKVSACQNEPRTNKLPDLSFLTSSGSSAASSRRNSSESSISLQLLEQKQPPKVPDDEQKADFLKVQDYLNELDILSQQNTFRIETETKEPEITTPQRPQSLLTPLTKKPNTYDQNRLSQILTNTPSPTNAGTQMLLHLQILKQQQNTDDLLNLYTNSSETSSGYMSNSTQNLNNQEVGNNSQRARQPMAKQQQPDSSHNSSTCSSSLTPPMPACLLDGEKHASSRFTYTGCTPTPIEPS